MFTVNANHSTVFLDLFTVKPKGGKVSVYSGSVIIYIILLINVSTRQPHKPFLGKSCHTISGNGSLKCRTKEYGDCFTLRSQQGSYPLCLGHQDPPHTQPAALLVTPDMP